MNIYISGISGTGMGPLALMAKQAGFNVFGSDLQKGAIYDELINSDIEVKIGEQDGNFFKAKLAQGIDWFCYTSALPANHPELLAAKEANIKCTKRDDLTAYLVDKLNLKMVAVAGTHGKTTTTAMIIWTALQLGLPVSYIVGSTLGFAPSGAYHKGDKYFVYEADEYDRNFLKYHPWLAVIPSVSYDHPDIYKTKADYEQAFAKFRSQSQAVVTLDTLDGHERVALLEGDPQNVCGSKILGEETATGPAQNYTMQDFKLPGAKRREDAMLAAVAISKIIKLENSKINYQSIIDILNNFPGVGRRFEKLKDGLYTDYAHHPEEIAATIEIAKEQAAIDHKKGVVVIYEPHQNSRQHEVKSGYKDAFDGIDKLYWLPTYLTREDPNLSVITPEDFIKELANSEIAEPAELNDELKHQIQKYLADNYLVILMTAGPADPWLRQNS